MSPLEEVARLADIPVPVEVELGRRELTMREILKLTEGSVIVVNRPAGENLAIIAGGALMASGEIVIIENTIGVRITKFRTEE